MSTSTFHYDTYIRTTSEKLWSALTDAESIKQWWFGVRCESEFTSGSSWKLVYPDGHISDTGEIVEVEPLRRLVIRWHNHGNPEFKAEGASLCTFELESNGPAVKLSVTHTIAREKSKLIDRLSLVWPMPLSNLKSLLENGSVVLHAPFPIQNAVSRKE